MAKKAGDALLPNARAASSAAALALTALAQADITMVAKGASAGELPGQISQPGSTERS